MKKTNFSGIPIYYLPLPRLVSVFKRNALIVECGHPYRNKIYCRGHCVGYENEEIGNLIITNPTVVMRIKKC